METARTNPSNDFKNPSAPLRELLIDAARFGSRGEFPYNLALAVIVLVWLVATWPHFRPP